MLFTGTFLYCLHDFRAIAMSGSISCPWADVSDMAARGPRDIAEASGCKVEASIR